MAFSLAVHKQRIGQVADPAAVGLVAGIPEAVPLQRPVWVVLGQVRENLRGVKSASQNTGVLAVAVGHLDRALAEDSQGAGKT